MAGMARLELPGALHLVEQRLCRNLPARSHRYERGASMILLRWRLKENRVLICGHNFLPRRTLLVLIPRRAGAIGHALAQADRLFAHLYYMMHDRFAPLWESPYHCCPVADEAAWPLLRYVDLASECGGPEPFAQEALSSATEHAGGNMGFLTASRDRLPPAERWRDWLESPQDKQFVRALELCLRTGKPFGPFPFVRRVERECHQRARSACLTWPGLFDSSAKSRNK